MENSNEILEKIVEKEPNDKHKSVESCIKKESNNTILEDNELGKINGGAALPSPSKTPRS